MSFIFSARTTDGYSLKVLSELLQHTIKTAYYEIDQTGIYLKMSDSRHHVMFDISLPRDNFYSFDLATDKLCFAITQLHMSTMLRIVKKKDTVVLFINSESPTELGIRVEPREKTNITTSYIKICPSYNIAPFETNGPYPITVPVQSSDYAKMCKEMAKLCKTIHVSSGTGAIKFVTESNNIFSKEVLYGDPHTVFTSTASFSSKYLSNVSKMAGLSTIIHFQHIEGSSLHIKSLVGSLGKMSVYLKSNEQMHADESSDEEIIEI
jgi:hypothetical protein